METDKTDKTDRANFYDKEETGRRNSSLYDCHRSILSDYKGLGVPGIVLHIHSSPELTRLGFAGVHKFRIVAQYRSPSNP